MRHAEFDVRGLSCELSVASVVGALAFVPGVSAVTLCLPQRSIRVSFDPRKADVSQFLRAAAATGHAVRERAPQAPTRSSFVSAGGRCVRVAHTEAKRAHALPSEAGLITKR